jgi:predicted transposase/invertase (TIGR01784 family)
MEFIPLSQALREIYIQDAKKEGKEEGKEEGKKEVAKNLLSKQMPISEIASITGLTETEIMAIP